MLFNSFLFVGFLVAFFPVYFALARRTRQQNAWLLLASYVFYGNWDLRFLLLLMFSTVVDFLIAKSIANTEAVSGRKRLLLLSLAVNFGVLGFFKYFNFFQDNFAAVLHVFGVGVTPFELKVLLPVGVSFYTFQSIGYIIDVYRGRTAPITNLADYALFVAFFPQLMAGPIERAGHLMPQILGPRRTTSDHVSAGMTLILWGYFKKIVIADNVATIANQVFDGYQGYQGLDLVIGALAFTLQIYGDFSGYSDIARGIAKLMGFDLAVNFRLPYMAGSPSEFWQRWHISLSSWLRDYLYISLGGNRNGEWQTLRNLMLTMLLGGLWHGAAWNFVVWGGYHGALLIAYRVLDRSPASSGWFRRTLRVALMFMLVVLGWVFFRAESFAQIEYFLTHLGLRPSKASVELALPLLYCAAPLLLVEGWQHVKGNLLALTKLPIAPRVLAYSLLLVGIALFSVRTPTEFIYFQF